jgi:hypothetical protein
MLADYSAAANRVQPYLALAARFSRVMPVINIFALV